MMISPQRNVAEIKPTRRRLWQLFSAAAHRQPTDVGPGAKWVSVRLIDASRRAPATSIEVQLFSLLKKEGSVSYDRLVQRVADELYQGELEHGAAALDIGVFGGRLFEPDVVAAIHAADGVLWEITSGEGNV